MPHHMYRNKKFPEFSFNVPTLIETVKGTKFPSGVVKFHNGHLLTESLQINGVPPWVTVQQADVIHEWIKTNKGLSGFQFIEEIDPKDKSRPCPYCFTRFKTAKELKQHLDECQSARPVNEPDEGKIHLGVQGVR